MKYGIGSICDRIHPKMARILNGNPFVNIAYIACCDSLPEMKYDNFEDAIHNLKEIYINEAYIKETEKDIETKVFYVIDERHNLLAILNFNKQLIINEHIGENFYDSN